MTPRPTLIVFAKPPVLGRVKTRLARQIGAVAASRFYRLEIARLLRELKDDPRWRLVLAADAGAAPAAMAAFARARAPVMLQGAGDLGARMARALAAAPPGPAAIIGSDIPGVTRDHVARAFRLLRNHDAVFGPSPDGGYWLVGLKRLRPYGGAFAGVRWSSAHALEDSVRALPASYSVAYADSLRDVDTAADLRDAIERNAPRPRRAV